MGDCRQPVNDRRKAGPKLITRNAMGEYIVPPGGKPLTSLENATPGPADYLPKIDVSKVSGPVYSLYGPYKSKTVELSPGPAYVNTRKSAKWRHRTINLKPKGNTRPYDIRENAHMTLSVGPGRCDPSASHAALRDYGPQWSMGQRHLPGINSGPPNSLVQPVDTHRDECPGPEKYRPNSGFSRSKFRGKGPQSSFGLGFKPDNPQGPGPMDYDVRSDASTAGKSFGVRLPPPWNQMKGYKADGPGPGAYDPQDHMEKGLSKSIGILPPESESAQLYGAPAPNLYTIEGSMGGRSTHTACINWRPITPERKPHPGPAEYQPSDDALRSAPQFSFGKKTKASFPQILNYPLIAHPSDSEPGPGTYEQTHGMLSSNEKPRFYMGARTSSKTNSNPGPNQYKLTNEAAKGPSFSFGRPIKTIDKKVSPGPAAYLPSIVKTSSGFSMLQRAKPDAAFHTPAPNAYNPKTGFSKTESQAGIGPTMKGRPSPFVYSGRNTTRLIETSQ